MKQAGGAM